MQRWRSDLALVVVTLIWGSTFVIVKHTLDTVSPFVLISARFWAATVALCIAYFVVHSGRVLELWKCEFGALKSLRLVLKQVKRNPVPFVGTTSLIRDGFLTGLILAGGFITQTLGLMTTKAGKTAFITGLNVVMVPVFSIFLLRKPPALSAMIGVLLATVGLGFLTLDKNLTLAPGDVWVLVCAVFFALHIIVTDRISPRHEVLAYTLVQMVTVATVSLVVALFLERGSLVPPLSAVPAVLYLGVAATALVFGLQTWAQRHTAPTRTALIFILEPVFAAVFAVILTHERLHRQEWFGGGLILLGMIVAEMRSSTLTRPQMEQL